MEAVRENMDLRIIPVHEATVQPDFLERADSDHTI